MMVWYGNFVTTLLPVNTEAPPTCGSNLLFVRGSQSEESQLEGSVAIRGEEANSLFQTEVDLR